MRHLDDEGFERLERLVALLTEDDTGLADREFVALATHRLDQHGEVQQAAARHGELLRALDRVDPQCDVSFQLLHEPVAKVAGGKELARLARERRGVDAKHHAQSWFIDREPRKRPWVGGIADRVADLDILDSTHGGNVASSGLLHIHAAQFVEYLQPHHLRVDEAGGGGRSHDGSPLDELARLEPADGDPADIVGPAQRGHEHLQGGVVIDHRPRDLLEDEVEERLHRAFPHGRIVRGKAVAARCVDEGKVGEVVVGPEFEEQPEDLVENLQRPGIGPVDLVDHDDGA